MKIIFFAKGDRKLPSARTRAFLISDYIKTLGYESEAYHIKTRPWWELSLERLRELQRNISILLSIKKDDRLFLQRTIYQIDFFILVLLRKFLFRRGYIFDFDDAIFLEKGHCTLKTKIIVKYADVVIVGSHFLKEYAIKLNKNVFIITTLLDTERIYLPQPNKPASDEVVIGWTGSPVHYENLKILVHPLQRLVNEQYNIRLILLGLSGNKKIRKLFEQIRGLKSSFIDFLPWDNPREVVRFIQNFDIGVMPLTESEWNKGKDAYKAKEYMACGVATLCSAVGENNYIIKDGINGLLASNESEWYEKLKKLITDLKYRDKIARGGRLYIEKECSYKTFVPKIMEIIQSH